VKISEEPPEKKQKRSEACSQLLRTAWSDDCNFSSTGGLKCLDCLKPFTDIVELLQHVHEDHHSFAADSNNTFDKNENIFVPNAILNGNEYDFVCDDKEETKLVKVGDKRSYENMTYVCHLCHEAFASKIDLYKDYLKHIAFFKCEICKSDKTQFGTRSEYVSHIEKHSFYSRKDFSNVKTVLDSVI